jgi:signal transduction histidine kinase
MNQESTGDLINFEYFYNTAPCGLLTFEIKGPIVYANQTLLKWLSTTADEIANKKFTDILDRAGVMYYELFVQPILKMHQEVKEIKLNIKTPMGAFACLFNGVAITDKAANREIINALIFKVEDRQKYENELLLKRTRAEEEKQVKSKALEELSFNQAHLIRAPLANIMGLLTILEQINHTNEEVKQIVAMLQESASELDQQVRTIVGKADLNI